MEVSGHIHIPDNLPQGKEPLVPSEYEVAQPDNVCSQYIPSVNIKLQLRDT
jgi:hypothetical protein